MSNIYVEWEGPYSYEDIRNKEKEGLGIYQIYGTHPIYGRDVLLYIGITIKQNFIGRLKERDIITYNSDEVKIYLTKTIEREERCLIRDQKIGENCKDEAENVIKVYESLLIYELSPAKNSSNINSLGAEFSKYFDDIFINSGRYASLPTSIAPSRHADYKINILLELLHRKYCLKITNDNKLFTFEDNTESWYGFYFKYKKYEDCYLGCEDNIYWQRGEHLVLLVDGKNYEKNYELDSEGYVRFPIRIPKLEKIPYALMEDYSKKIKIKIDEIIENGFDGKYYEINLDI